MSYYEDIDAAVRAGLDFLLRHQDPDGFWRDYNLKLGPSECWTTAWVGWLLSPLAEDRLSARMALGCAARALTRSVGLRGWGYNLQSTADADSTAWALRFLALLGYLDGRRAEVLLSPFFDASCITHTFQRFEDGAWAGQHWDVTPAAGAALQSCGGNGVMVRRIRNAVLGAFDHDRCWPSYWWRTDTYATTHCLHFLSITGGIPSDVTGSVTAWLSCQVEPATPLEASWLLSSNCLLGLHRSAPAQVLVTSLLSSQDRDGGWSESAELLIPPRWDGDSLGNAGPYADVRRIVSTANAIYALQHCRVAACQGAGG
jgi:hypothetical protein